MACDAGFTRRSSEIYSVTYEQGKKSEKVRSDSRFSDKLDFLTI